MEVKKVSKRHRTSWMSIHLFHLLISVITLRIINSWCHKSLAQKHTPFQFQSSSTSQMSLTITVIKLTFRLKQWLIKEQALVPKQCSILHNLTFSHRVKSPLTICLTMNYNLTFLLLISWGRYLFQKIWKTSMKMISRMLSGSFQELFQNHIGILIWVKNSTLHKWSTTSKRHWRCHFNKERWKLFLKLSRMTKRWSSTLEWAHKSSVILLQTITQLLKSCWYAWHTPTKSKSITMH